MRGGAECARLLRMPGVVKQLTRIPFLPWAKDAFAGRQSWEAGRRPESQPARSPRTPRPRLPSLTFRSTRLEFRFVDARLLWFQFTNGLLGVGFGNPTNHTRTKMRFRDTQLTHYSPKFSACRNKPDCQCGLRGYTWAQTSRSNTALGQRIDSFR